MNYTTQIYLAEVCVKVTCQRDRAFTFAGPQCHKILRDTVSCVKTQSAVAKLSESKNPVTYDL